MQSSMALASPGVAKTLYEPKAFIIHAEFHGTPLEFHGTPLEFHDTPRLCRSGKQMFYFDRKFHIMDPSCISFVQATHACMVAKAVFDCD